MATLNSLLKQIGLTPQEIQLFMELLKSGSATPTELANTTGIHRVTIYSVAKKLLSRGLILEQKHKSGVQFRVHDPEQVMEMVKTEEKQLQHRFAIAEEIVDQLRRVESSGQQHLIPQYQVVSGVDVETFLHDRTLVWDKSAQEKDGIWWGFQNERFIETHSKWLKWFWEHAHRSTHVRLFSNAKLAELTKKEHLTRREVKVLSESTFTATTWVIGDYIVQITSPDNPYLIEIKHETLAENHRAVFKALWERV